MARELTLAQAAPLTGLSEQTLRRRCAAGQIRGARMIGKTWVIPGRAVASIVRHRLPKGGRVVRELEGGARIVERPDIEAEYGIGPDDNGVYELIGPDGAYLGTWGFDQAAELHWARMSHPEANQEQ